MPHQDPGSGCVRKEREELLQFGKHFVANFQPIDPTSIDPLEVWLDKTPYSGDRKRFLANLHRTTDWITPDFFKSKSFGKLERHMSDYKHIRLICSPSEEQKAYVGRFIAAFEKAITAHKAFIVKHGDPRELPSKLKEIFRDLPVMETDYSSMEAHFAELIAALLSYALHHMFRKLRDRVLHQVLETMARGRNHLDSKYFAASIDERLMSGIMYTSVANGLLNIVLMSYVIFKSRPDLYGSDPKAAAKLLFDNFPGVVEGDDGMTIDLGQDNEIFTRLGVCCKPQKHSKFYEANFCSINCPEHCDTPITDPRKVISKLSILLSKHSSRKKGAQLQMVRAMAMSYYYMYRDVPVVGTLCHEILRRTKHVNITQTSFDDWALDRNLQYLREKGKSSAYCRVPPSVDISVREHVASVFNITVNEQLSLERWIRESPHDQINLPYSIIATPFEMNHMITYSAPEGEQCLATDLPNHPCARCPNLKGRGSPRCKALVSAAGCSGLAYTRIG